MGKDKDKEPTIKDLQKQIAANMAAITNMVKEAEELRLKGQAERDKREAERKKEQAERDKRADERFARLEKSMADTDRRIKKLSQDFGTIGNDRGFAFERAVCSTLDDTKEIGGIRLDGVRFNASSGKDGYQYDIVGLNGKSTVVVETKLSLSVKDVLHFADNRLPFFAEMLPEYAKGKKIIGAMVYQRTDDKGEAVAAALSRGFLVLCADSKKYLRQITAPGDIKERNKPPRKNNRQ